MNWKNTLQDRFNRLVTGIRTSASVHYIIRWWTHLTPSTRALPVHLWRAVKSFADNDTRQAAALSYYAVFSIFPLSLLLAVSISALLGPAAAEEQIAQGLALFLPQETETIELFQDNLADALEQSGSFGLFAVVGLTWSALGLFSNLTASLDRIFQAPATRSLWRKRLLAFFMTLVLILLVLVSFLTSGVLRLVDAFLITNPSVWITISTFFLPFGLNMVIFALLFRYVPSRQVHWDAIWPAAILGAIGLELAKSAFALYLGTLTNFQFVYGSIATVIVLLLWAYLVACIFLVSAEICSQVDIWFANQTEPPRISIFSETQLPAEIPPPL